MSVHSADPDALDALAHTLIAARETVGRRCSDACGVLSTHGYTAASASVAGTAAAAEEWLGAWEVSLNERAELLEVAGATTITLGSTSSRSGIDFVRFALNNATSDAYPKWVTRHLASRLPASPDDRVRELEQRLAALAAMGDERKTSGWQIAGVATQLLQARLDAMRAKQRLLAELLGVPAHAPEHLAAAITDLERDLERLGAKLALDANDFVLAAEAMIAGISPRDAGLEPAHFPEWYVERHALAARLATEAAAAETATWQAFDELMLVGLAGHWDDHRGATDRFETQRTLWQDTQARLDTARAQLAVTVEDAAAYLATLTPVAPETRPALVADLLAAEIERSRDDPVRLLALGALAARYVDTDRLASLVTKVAGEGLDPGEPDAELVLESVLAFANGMASSLTEPVLAATPVGEITIATRVVRVPNVGPALVEYTLNPATVVDYVESKALTVDLSRAPRLTAALTPEVAESLARGLSHTGVAVDVLFELPDLAAAWSTGDLGQMADQLGRSAGSVGGGYAGGAAAIAVVGLVCSSGVGCLVLAGTAAALGSHGGAVLGELTWNVVRPLDVLEPLGDIADPDASLFSGRRWLRSIRP